MDRAYAEFDGSNDENWLQGYYYAGSRFIISPNPAVDESAYGNVISNYLFTIYTDTQTVGGIRVLNNNRFDSYWDSSITSNITEFRAYLSSNPLQVCYKLATPYTIHLTPQQLNLLKATNNISTDAKTISVTYRNGELSTYAPATDIADGLLTATDKRAIDRTSEIIEGNPIQFSTESKQIARSTIIDLEPIQDLHGYSKPWVGGAGKNKLPLTVDGIKTVNTNGTWNGNTFTPTGQNITYTIMTDSDNNVVGIKINGTNGNVTYTFSLAVYDFGENNFNSFNQPSVS